jgi:uncharacterized cupin superfamily protein
VPAYTKKNFMDIDNVAAGRYEGMEARFGRSQLDSEHLGVTYLRFDPGKRSQFGHRHREQEEAYVVVEGSGRARLDGELVELSRWDVLRVAPAVVRGFEAGPDGLVLVAIGADRPEGGDGELVEDWWQDD